VKYRCRSPLTPLKKGGKEQEIVERGIEVSSILSQAEGWVKCASAIALPQNPILPDSPFFNSWLFLADCDPKLN